MVILNIAIEKVVYKQISKPQLDCIISSGSITAFVLLCLIIHCTSTCVICCYTCLSSEGVDECCKDVGECCKDVGECCEVDSCCEVVGACCKVMGACCKEGGLCCKCHEFLWLCCEGDAFCSCGCIEEVLVPFVVH